MQQALRSVLQSAAAVVVLLAIPATARAHCDTMDGPVVKAAQQALATRNINHVLLWVRTEDEGIIRSAFQRTLTVRAQGDAARELADYWFFETLVRVHREGEGAPYSGLKPAGTEEHAAVAAADRAIASGKVDEVEQVVLHVVRDGIREHFQAALRLKGFEVNDVQAGRAYVQAYVPFLHYVEGIYDAARAGSAHAKEHAPAGRPHP